MAPPMNLRSLRTPHARMGLASMDRPWPRIVSTREIALFIFVFVASFQSTSALICKDCFAFPNTCPTNQTLTDLTAYRNTTDPLACPDVATCCQSANFNCTILPNIRCSNNWQSKCPEGTWDRYSWPDSPTACLASCPINFHPELAWTLFCVADNCFSVAGYDSTVCTGCNPGFRFVNDTSCQLPPTFNFRLWDGSFTFNFTGLGGTTMVANANYSTNLRNSTKALNVSISLLSTGRQTRFSSDPLAPPAGNVTTIVNGTAFCTIEANMYNFTTSLQNSTITFLYTFPLGFTNITCVAADRNGLSSSVSLSVQIVDREAPQVTCPGNIALNTLFQQNYATYDFNRSLVIGTQVRDNVGVTFSLCTGNSNSSIFRLNRQGTASRTITCSNRDAAGNTANCTYVVRVFDREAPRVTCPANRVFNTTLNSNFTTGTNVSFVVGLPNSVDNVAVNTVTCSVSPLSSATQFPIGLNNYTCTARDFANNASSCNFTVLVLDNQPPALTCPNLTIPTIFSTSYATTVLGVSASDNSKQSVNITCAPGGFPNAGNFSVGMTTATCTGVDRSGNVGTCRLNVTVFDQSPPLITCPAPIVTDMLPDLNYTMVNYSATAWDNVNVTSVNCTPPSNSRFDLGSTLITCIAMDAARNSINCQSSVVVQDTQPPSVHCPAGQIVATNLTSNITVSFTAPNSTDNLGIQSTQLSVAAAAPLTSGTINTTFYTFNTSGTATFTYYAYDLVGNSNLCYWSITVLPPLVIPDTSPPNITGCPTNATFVNPAVSYSAYPNSTFTITRQTIVDKSFTNITLPALNATDNSNLVTISYLDWSANPQTTFFVGNYVVAFKAVDISGNAAYCVYRVSVVDPQPPRWTNCPINMTSRTGAGRSNAPALSWPPLGIIAVDNVQVVNPYGSCVSQPSGYCPPSGNISTVLYPVGVVVFLYDAIDTSGNVAPTCVFSVTVIDDDPPALSGCPTQPIQSRTNFNVSYADMTPLCPNFTYFDNVDVRSTALSSAPAGYNCSSRIPIINGLSFTFQVTDTSGLTASCLFTVSVLDIEKPVIPNCPLNSLQFAVNTDLGSSLATVTFPPLVAVDNSGLANITSLSFPTAGLNSGSLFPLGVTSILFNAMDMSLNGASCIVIITVADIEPPTLENCPNSNFVLPNNPGKASAWLVLPDLNATDNVHIQGASFFPYYFEAGRNFTFTIGFTPIEYTAQDTSFNKAQCRFSVTVYDNEAPTFYNCPHGQMFNLTADLNMPSTVFRFPPITVVDNFDPLSTYSVTSQPVGLTDGSAFIVGTTVLTLLTIDSAGNRGVCSFSVTVLDLQPPTITCPENQVFQTLSSTDTRAPVAWRTPIVSDNFRVASVVTNVVQGNWSLGTYYVDYNVTDTSGNMANCTFNVTVLQAAPSNLGNSAAGASTSIVAGAGGGAGLLLLLLLGVLLFMRKSHRKKLQRAVSGYAEFMAMSDELILERARVIQQALLEQRLAKPPRLLETEFVHPERKFAAPPSTLDGLMQYMRETCNKEIDRSQLEIGSELGAGEFGSVFDGHCVYGDKGRTKVAIKMLKQATEDSSKVQFLKEAAIMAQFSHPNIVELVGVCTLPADEPTLIVLEFMHLGSLYSYLQSTMVRGNLEVLTMIRMALDIAAGMQYLAEAGFVHRDLAARNVLLDKSMTCRIGDFGLSIDLAASSTSTSSKSESIYGGADELPTPDNGDANMKIPIRWTAIEAIMFKQFSSASDVWSFGITLWEIFSYAELPYKGMSNKKVIEDVSKGYRMPKPDGCPYDAYRLMIECWDSNAKRRITFYKVHTALVQIWKDLDKSSMLPEDGAAGGTLYETSGGMEPDQMLYGNGPSRNDPPSDDEGDGDYATAGQKERELNDYSLAGASSPTAVRSSHMSGNGTGSNELYDIGEDDGYAAAVGSKGGKGGKAAPAATAASAGAALYDMGVDPIDLLGSSLPLSTSNAQVNNPLFERGAASPAPVGASAVVRTDSVTGNVRASTGSTTVMGNTRASNGSDVLSALAALNRNASTRSTASARSTTSANSNNGMPDDDGYLHMIPEHNL